MTTFPVVDNDRDDEEYFLQQTSFLVRKSDQILSLLGDDDDDVAEEFQQPQQDGNGNKHQNRPENAKLLAKAERNRSLSRDQVIKNTELQRSGTGATSSVTARGHPQVLKPAKYPGSNTAKSNVGEKSGTSSVGAVRASSSVLQQAKCLESTPLGSSKSGDSGDARTRPHLVKSVTYPGSKDITKLSRGTSDDVRLKGSNVAGANVTDLRQSKSLEIELQNDPAVRIHSDAILKMVSDEKCEVGDQEASSGIFFPAKNNPTVGFVDKRSSLRLEKKMAMFAGKEHPSKNNSLACSKQEANDSVNVWSVANNSDQVSSNGIMQVGREDTEEFVSPVELSRDQRFLPQPGAMRIVRGQCRYEDDDDDDNENEADSVNSARLVGNRGGMRGSDVYGSQSPIEAVLVEDQEAQEASERERELAEREAKIRERELELERKMQQMSGGTAVQVEVVSASPLPNRTTTKKGLFSIFKRGRTPQPPPPPKDKRFSATTALVATTTVEPAALVNKAVDKQLGASIPDEADEVENLAAFADQFHRKPNVSIPLFEKKEIKTGEQIGQGKFFNVVLLNGLELNQGWEYPECQRSFLTRDDIVGLQRRREKLVRRCTSKKKEFVVKYMRPDLDNRKRVTASLALMSEASLLETLAHENIIKICGMSEGSFIAGTERVSPNFSFFFVMERLQENLFDCLTKSWRRKVRGPQFFLDRVKVATDLAAAVDYLHSLNIMFCDLKPENVGFTRAGTLKLYNFCGAKALTASTRPYDVSCHTMSPFVGTHPYVAPEVALKRPSGISVDTYAFSIILWEIMTMKEPFADLMIYDYAEKVIEGNKRPKLEKKTPDELNQLMSNCWNRDQFSRPSMKDVHLRLLQLQQQLEVPETKKGFLR